MKKSFLSAILVGICCILSSCESGNDDSEDKVTLKKITVEAVEYFPAPGQFCNIYPEINEGDTYETVLSRATEALNNDKLVTLGSFGGFVTVKTDHPITGRFQVAGNAIVSSSEPGIVQISQDGETWYTICGEHYMETEEIMVEYFMPGKVFEDETYIKWKVKSTGETGYVARIPEYHTQPYIPYFYPSDAYSVMFPGHRLPNNGKFNTEIEQYQLAAYLGYADSYPNASPKSYLDPKNIVDSNMQPASLTSFSYIKVYTGVLQSNGILGECSTEVTGFYEVIE